MKLTAIWDQAESVIFFYGPTGERLSRTVIHCDLTCAYPNSQGKPLAVPGDSHG